MNDARAAAPRRLQLGTSRFENLPARIVATFADPSWVSLGEPPPAHREANARTGTVARARRAVGRALGRALGRDAPRVAYDPEPYRQTSFLAWYYRPGLSLPFRDSCFDFAFSEHFFEHLFLDDAFGVLRECHRVLRHGGVLRTSVPDADLRGYEAPEPVGYGAPVGRTGHRLDWTHPNIHKTRWSIHSLPLLLEQAGFRAVPLVWCDAGGALHERAPRDLHDAYAGCTDRAMIDRLDYLLRPRSLIVDAVRP